MQQAIILTLDATTTAMFETCVRTIDPSMGPIPPHVTLGLVETDDEATLVDAVAQLATEIPRFPITFGSLGRFMDGLAGMTIFAAPIVTMHLLTLHRRFADLIDRFESTHNELYRPDSWIPHCTLALHIPWDRVEPVIPILRNLQLPIKGTVEGVSIVRFPVIRTIATFALSQP